jgi:4-hydroxybenzoate polyprenyltransferase
MGDIARRGGRGRAHALRIIHPFPTLLNVVATAGLAFVAADGSPDASVLVRMLLLMLFAQSAIGVTNDLFDRDLDAAAKPWKPLVAGAIDARQATMLVVLLVVGVVLIGVTLGPASLGLAVLGLACGLAYDVRLKRSMFSGVPYMIAIPTLPIWVWVTLGEWQPDLWWLLALGPLIGLALHLANTLPDLEADARSGVFGLAHRLGAARSMLLAWAAFAGALATSLGVAPLVEYDAVLYAVTLGTGVAALTASIGAYAVRRDGFALQLGFGLLGVGAAALAVGWLAAVT